MHGLYIPRREFRYWRVNHLPVSNVYDDLPHSTTRMRTCVKWQSLPSQWTHRSTIGHGFPSKLCSFMISWLPLLSTRLSWDATLWGPIPRRNIFLWVAWDGPGCMRDRAQRHPILFILINESTNLRWEQKLTFLLPYRRSIAQMWYSAACPVVHGQYYKSWESLLAFQRGPQRQCRLSEFIRPWTFSARTEPWYHKISAIRWTVRSSSFEETVVDFLWRNDVVGLEDWVYLRNPWIAEKTHIQRKL